MEGMDGLGTLIVLVLALLAGMALRRGGGAHVVLISG